MPKKKSPDSLLQLVARRLKKEVEIAPDSAARPRFREYNHGGHYRKVFTALGILDEVGHKAGGAKDHDGSQESSIACVMETYEFEHQELTGIRRTGQNVGLKERHQRLVSTMNRVRTAPHPRSRHRSPRAAMTTVVRPPRSRK